jgi:membrane-associated protein
MTTISSLLLTGLITYGAPVFGLALLFGAIGIPLPSTLLVVAAGAFGRQGMLDSFSASLFGLAGAVAGDSLSYAIGYFAHAWVQRRFGNSCLWLKAQKTFQQRGSLAIFSTRFLLTSIALPTNLIAGSSRYPFLRYLSYVLAGEFIWIAGYGGLGYLFGNQWELISDFLTNFGGFALGLVLLSGAGMYLYSARQKITKVYYQRFNKTAAATLMFSTGAITRVRSLFDRNILPV